MLLIFGLGYTGAAVAAAARVAGWEVAGTSRSGAAGAIPFAHAADAIALATHILVTAAPDDAGDPVLALYADALAAAPALRWIGYLSSTVVYGDRGGGWVDETTPPAPSSARGERRVAAERAWTALARDRYALDLFRLAGIYGPGRSILDELRAGRARRIDQPGHGFGRIHRDDIVRAVLAAMAPLTPPSWPGLTRPSTQDRPCADGRVKPGHDGGGPAVPRVLNLTDDLPAEAADVAAYAAALLGLPVPPLVPFAQAYAAMSPMARSFWAENRKVSSRATQAALGITWQYPSYREGLAAILVEERQQGFGQ